MRRILVCAAAAALVLTGCSDPLAGNRQQQGIVLGSADFAESEVLMHIYAEALRSTGTEVETTPRIGAREFYVQAVRDGEITVMPDYTGNLLEQLDPESAATETGQVRRELDRALPPELQLLQHAPAEDTDVLTVTGDTAADGVRSMQDLGPRCREFVLGAPAEWKQRWQERIAELYDCRFAEIRSVEAGTLTVDALTGGDIQVANLFSTSAQIRANGLVPLDDPKNMFPAQNVVPLVHRDALDPQQTAVLDRVSASLDTADLTRLNERLEQDKANPVDVAREYVRELGI
ncbi:ABC transporter substrate-binding protein [Saccharopolyspora sp. HNM0983]|uniref:ABC transporter substrate-binding protein n=2 Tax=Saccharopolyspora montiporae TaxID=2781240 RepID=A0A929BD28_9PSEU|nr:ABC transporter substrate-binding protein [Saccharopolyspora sp. HNM0983]